MSTAAAATVAELAPNAATVVTEESGIRPLPLASLAVLYLEAKAQEAAAASRASALKAVLLDRLSSEGVASVETPAGSVSLVAGSTRTTVDIPAMESKVCELAARLRAHGEEVDDSTVLQITKVAPSIRMYPLCSLRRKGGLSPGPTCGWPARA